MKYSANTIGDIGETILLTELKMRGFCVAIPFGHEDPFDLLVVNKIGRSIKVQVKCSSKPRSGSTYSFYRIKSFEHNDVYALLLMDRWYFMTSREAKKRITKHGTISLCKSRISLDNFEIFD